MSKKTKVEVVKAVMNTMVPEVEAVVALPETNTLTTADIVTHNVVRPGKSTPVETLKLNMAKPEGNLQFNKDTALFILYMFYKANMISRLHLKRFFQIINEPVPDDIAKWLLEEAGKA